MLVKTQTAGLGVYDSLGLEYSLRICITNQSAGDDDAVYLGSHFEGHCFMEKAEPNF